MNSITRTSSIHPSFAKEICLKDIPQLPEDCRGFLGDLALFELATNHSFQTVLDIGSGKGEQASFLEKNGKTVQRMKLSREQEDPRDADYIYGDFLSYPFTQDYDLVWASHVLEHTLHTQLFLEKIIKVCKKDGVIAITVPPAKAELVGGHVTLWTTGLLLYRLVLAGLDCSKAQCLRYGYNISVIVKNQRNNLDVTSLSWNFHDIEKIKEFLPPDVTARSDGDMIGDVYAGTLTFIL